MNSYISKPISILLIGCGNRGKIYASYALDHPSLASLVGLADPRAHVRKLMVSLHSSTIDPTKIFSNYKEILSLPSRIADAVIIALPDKLHVEAAVSFLEKGYHILLEKPMAVTLDQCRLILETCRKFPSQINAVCHVLRYLPPCLKIKEIISSGLIGDVVNINHVEPVGFWHFAHSYVRGNWRSEIEACCSLLAKCCHDIDLIIDWMGNNECAKVSSFGSLFHFNKKNAPENAGKICLKCPAEQNCAYSAKKIYLDSGKKIDAWPLDVVLAAELQNPKETKDIEDLYSKYSEAELKELLWKGLENEKTQYGRCVYSSDNDVCDNQVVNMQFANGATANLTMIAFSKDLCDRKTRIYGTKGELEWDSSVSPNEIWHFDFLSNKREAIKVFLV